MRTLGARQLVGFSAVGLGAALFMTGCPAQPACPTCRYRSAGFSVTADDVKGVTSADMHAVIEHKSGECPGRGGTEECTTDEHVDVTCKVKSPGSKSVLLPVASGDGATHTVTVTLQKSTSITKPATVGEPSQKDPPPPICP